MYNNNIGRPQEKDYMLYAIYASMVMQISYLLWSIISKKFFSSQMYLFRDLINIFCGIIYLVDSIMMYKKHKKISLILLALFFSYPYPWVRANANGDDVTIPKVCFFVELFLLFVFVGVGMKYYPTGA